MKYLLLHAHEPALLETIISERQFEVLVFGVAAVIIVFMILLFFRNLPEMPDL